MKHTLKDWIIATRPWSFPASVMPVSVTLFYLFATGRDVNWWIGLQAMVTIALFQAAGNTWSDWHDFRRGVDADDTFGSKILTGGLFQPREIIRLAIGLLTVATLSGLSIVLMAGIEVLWVGLAGFLLTILYPTLKFHALGDLDILLTYGLLAVVGTSWAVSGAFYWDTLWLVLPIGLITVAILHANNTRDIRTDARAGIRTFAMAMGRKWSVAAYTLEVLLPFVLLAVAVALKAVPAGALAAFVALPVAWKNARTMAWLNRDGEAAIAALDEATAQLQLIFSVLLSAAFLLTGLLA